MVNRERSISDSANFVGTSDDDTVVLELSADEVHALSRVASASEAIDFESQVLNTSPSKVGRAISNGSTDARIRPNAPSQGIGLAVAIGIAGALLILSSVAYLSAIPGEPLQADVNTPLALDTSETAASDAARETRPARATVRFANPFDATEVFEFPPDTSEIDARNAVADLLLQRARDRQKSGVRKSADHRQQLSASTSNQRS